MTAAERLAAVRGIGRHVAFIRTEIRSSASEWRRAGGRDPFVALEAAYDASSEIESLEAALAKEACE